MKIDIITPRPIILHNIVTSIEAARFSHNSKLCSTIVEHDTKEMKSNISDNDSEVYSFTVNIDNADQRLFKKLSNVPVGSGHDKLLACIPLAIDITAARYWWQEMDTYAVGTRKLSEATLHTILKSEITLDDFEIGHDLIKDSYNNKTIDIRKKSVEEFILKFNQIKDDNTIENIDKILMVKGILPESFLQKRRVFLNYSVLKTIYKQRNAHKLVEWRAFCNIIKDHSKIPFLYLAFDD